MNAEQRIQRNQEIISDYNAGVKVRNIALKHELSEVSISKIISAGRMVGQVTLVSEKGASGRNKEIASLYEEGMTMQAIAHKYDLSRERVRQILCAQGVESRSVGEANDAAYLKWVDENGDAINQMFNRTLSIRATASAMPEHPKTWVRRFLSGRKHEVVRTNSVKKFWTNERLVRLLAEASEDGTLTIPRYRKWRTSGATFEGRVPPTHAVIVWAFGSWNNALASAGLSSTDRRTSRVYKRTWSTDDAYAAVRAYSLHSIKQGRYPTFSGYGKWSSENPGHPSGTYIRVLTSKSWAELLRQVMKAS